MSVCVSAIVGREDGGDDADRRHDDERLRRLDEERLAARDEVHARGDHRRGVDQRAETGVGPSIASGNQTWSGNWALLPVAPTNSSSVATIATDERWPLRSPEDILDVQGADSDEDEPIMPMREARVADAVDDERFLGCQGRRCACGTRSRSADSRTGPPAPRRTYIRGIVRQDQHQHREHEEVEIGEEATATAVAGM